MLNKNFGNHNYDIKNKPLSTAQPWSYISRSDSYLKIRLKEMTYLSVADSPEVMRAFFRSVAMIEVGVNGLILLHLLRLRN